MFFLCELITLSLTMGNCGMICCCDGADKRMAKDAQVTEATPFGYIYIYIHVCVYCALYKLIINKQQTAKQVKLDQRPKMDTLRNIN